MGSVEWLPRLALIVAIVCLGAGAVRAEEAAAEKSPAEAVEEPESTAYEEFDDLYFDEDFEEDAAEDDPLEPVNRPIFRVNDALDRYAIEPVSRAWDFVLPDFAQRALRNAFDNLRFPIIFLNDVFQLKLTDAGGDLARFVLNSTVGIAGFMDPAATLGLPRRNEDFGQTLGFWGVPPGPYLMLPFFGPSNIRDGFGLIIDTGLRALSFFIPLAASFAMQGVDTLNRRSLIRGEIEAERRAALDWYAAVRSAYTQYRENLVHDRRRARDDFDYFPGLEIDADRPAQD